MSKTNQKIEVSADAVSPSYDLTKYFFSKPLLNYYAR